MIHKEQLYVIEFNYIGKGYPIHIEPLKSRIEKNATQVLNEGKLRNSDWCIIGVQYGFEDAVEYAARFVEEYQRRHGGDWLERGKI